MTQKDLLITPKVSCFSFKYVIIATLMSHRKRKHKFQGPSLGQTPRKVLGQGLYFTPKLLCPKFFRKILAYFSKMKMQKLKWYRGLLFSQSSCNIHTLRCSACVDSSTKSRSSVNLSKQLFLVVSLFQYKPKWTFYVNNFYLNNVWCWKYSIRKSFWRVTT